MKKLHLLLRTATLLLCMLLITATPVLAITQDEIIGKGVTAYEVDPSCFQADAAVGGAVVPKSTLDAILLQKPLYEQVAQTHGVPWQVYAAVDYREDNNRPDASMLGGEPLKQPSVDNPSLIPQTKLESIVMGADHFTYMANLVYKVDVSKPMNTDQLKQAFLAYNRGFIYKNAGASPDISPYVMNFFDAAHQNMSHPLTSVVPGETIPGVQDANLGALTLYTALGGGSSSGSCSVVPDGNILKFIVLYAWPEWRGYYTQVKPEYGAAIAAASARIAQGINDYIGYPRGIDCGGFVTRVMRDSGADPTYNSHTGNVIWQHIYIKENLGTKFREIDPNKEPLQAGDIGIARDDGHTLFYVGSVAGFNGKFASASGGGGNPKDRAPMAQPSENTYEYHWYRLVKSTGGAGGVPFE